MGQFHLFFHCQCSSLWAANSQRRLLHQWPLEEAEHQPVGLSNFNRCLWLSGYYCNQKWRCGCPPTQKLINSQGWWKGKFALFWMPATWGQRGGARQGRTPGQRPTPLLQWQSVAKSFYRQRKGAMCRNSTVSSDSHLEIGHAVVWSASFWLSSVNLQFEGRFVPVSLRPVLRIVAAYVMATVWSSCS